MSSGRCSDTCCSTSQICFNGGKCQAKCLQSGKRFKCACPDGFTGNRCEIKPRSCAPYIYSSNHTDGLRLIYAPDNTTYLVFCHFDVNTYSIRSDTLVMSYANSNKELFEKESLIKDFTRYQDEPNWLIYRLSLERMKALRDESIIGHSLAHMTREDSYMKITWEWNLRNAISSHTPQRWMNAPSRWPT